MIVLEKVWWQTTCGRPVICDLDLSLKQEKLGLIGANGVGKTTLLHLISGDLQSSRGSVSKTGSTALVRQVLRSSLNEPVSSLFGATVALQALRRAEAGLASLREFAEAEWSLEERIQSALASFDIAAHPDTPLSALSGGERTRASLAAAAFHNPDFLLLDEPTNNLDAQGRETVRQFLASWRKGAIVVSHDRQLLDEVGAILELTSLGAKRYGGNWTAYSQRKSVELLATERAVAGAQRRATEVEHSVQVATERQQRRDAGGRRAASRGGIPKVLLGSRRDRAERTQGDLTRRAERRLEAVADTLDTARAQLEVLQPIELSLPATRLPKGKTVLRLDGVTTGYVPGSPVIRDLSLTVVGPERIAIVGPNGAGKTTLLHLLSRRLEPWIGEVRLSVTMAAIDQQAAVLQPEASVRDNFLRINPGGTENGCRAALARFMFRADAALQPAGTLSGGQMVRAALACVLGGSNPPQLLVLDEPTNHLDIRSVQAIERGLRSYDGALIVVSHDPHFIEGVGLQRQVRLHGGTLADMA